MKTILLTQLLLLFIPLKIFAKAFFRQSFCMMNLLGDDYKKSSANAIGIFQIEIVNSRLKPSVDIQIIMKRMLHTSNTWIVFNKVVPFYTKK